MHMFLQVQKSYKDEGPRVGGRNDRVTVADEIVAASETEALAETNEPAGIKRR